MLQAAEAIGQATEPRSCDKGEVSVGNRERLTAGKRRSVGVRV